MTKHTMLMPRPEARSYMELSAMSGEKPDPRSGFRGNHASVFRPGHSVAADPVTYDLATGREIFSAPLPVAYINPARVWESIGSVSLSANHLSGNGLFPESTSGPATAAFDMLRTRLLHGLREYGWRRIAVTSPTHGCGKSFVATNLALALARRAGSRTVLLDLDLRRPQLAALLGITDIGPIEEFLSGDQPLESHFRRFGRTLALGLNGAPVDMASETLHDTVTTQALDSMVEQLDPEVVIYDLPPALVSDDVLALQPCIDAVLLVTDGTRTSPEHIRACEALFKGQVPLMGVVLNRAQDRASGRFRYGKD